ncbi:hypothetical protein [Caballeronia grimmiae]|uniref:Uncharacterized protein n=1 Tax=Caballeronia grimmiae TaxID=1071679 RepID=A0A069NJD3_9BURK|nr:hypothetical protein [Caballeronia grimmiae]KDR25116.1 hypothetical protein BG57_31945 [Caballeronia grimmiae]GGD93694.1 hypothetical protein GCM10010985_55530 [Caballeronia grimmiae]
MSRKKAKAKTNSNKDAFNCLANPLIAGMLADDQYASTAATFISRRAVADFRSDFKQLYQRKRFRRLFNASATTIEEFSVANIFRDQVAPSRLLELYLSLVMQHAEELRTFVALRDRFEISVLAGQYNLASNLLDELREKIGESLWYIRNRILVLSYQGKLQEMQDFAESCKSRSSDSFVTYLINCFLLIASDPLLHLQKIVQRTINELKEAEINEWADLLSLLFVPRPLFARRENLTCLPVIQTFGIVDQYHLICTLSAEILAHEIVAQTELDFVRHLSIFIEEMGSAVGDEAVPSSDPLSVQGRGNNADSSRLVRLYENDQSVALINEFRTRFQQFRTPFALANLVAKAEAIANTGLFRPDQGPVSDVIRHLSSLYDFSASPTRTADLISSIVVQLNHFQGSSQLQLSLYASMPLRYESEDRQWLARLAAISNADATPWTRTLTKDADPILSHSYLSDSHTLPQYRIIKQQIRTLSSTREDVDAKLDAFRMTVPLKKDYYELASSYLSSVNALGDVIPLCAATLAQQPNAFVAFPMRKLIEHIERTNAHTLDSLIIAYYYVKKIDSKKEYLLNETFEEFILSNDAARPSDLFHLLDELDARPIVFYRDIATLETMDFLGAFKDSNDLRSERVKILDHLRDLTLIEPDQHRAEVDEIVMQVVVDSGATEFNVAKIDVNDRALRRDLSQDVSSLLALYKSVKDGTEEKFIRVDGELLDGDTAQAVVAGDRNTTLLKIVNLVQDAFLYDEKHGLDKNLSAEIRHGFFSNLMRSKLEEARLLTEKDQNGQYKSNEFWLNSNTIIVEGILRAVDDQLKWFSANFNQLVEKAEEWMKVTADHKDTSRVFNYKLFLHDFRQFHTRAERSASGEEFLQSFFDVLWSHTEDCLSEMREKLNVEFRNGVDALFQELIERITTAKSGVGLVDLMAAITRVRNDIREDITTASEWFRRHVDYVSSARNLSELTEISIECFERVKGVRLNIVRDMMDLSAIRFDGRQIKSFIVAFVNILENACRHSGFGAHTAIRVSSTIAGTTWTLQVENSVTPDKLEALTPDRLTQIVEKMKGPSSLHMMRKEGGSGLSKAYNQLRSIKDHFDVNIFAEDAIFRTRISYG